MTANHTDARSPLERALGAIERLEAELEAAKRPEAEPIAIVGVGCRFPGGIRDFRSFTQRIFAAEPLFGKLPVDRFGAHPLLSEDEQTELAKRMGGFLASEEVEGFDPAFFRITPREAGYMDPQQRLLLRVAWEALEHAGIDPHALRGTHAEVYVGSHGRDYAQLGHDLDSKVSAHYSPGVDASFLSARISHFLDLHGTSLTVDTACSSSLVAIHLACKSLQTGRSSLALAGGVKLVLAPEIGLFLHKTGAMSPSGRCLPFDQSADGMVQAEGCGLLVLKRLSDARRDQDRIWGVIEGSAVNHDGTGAGLTVPNPAAQAQLIDSALRDARVHPHDVDYVEAHGTGTVVGDPIELRALARSYTEGRDPARPLLVGSGKATLGHSESAAGVAGVLRALAVLAAGRTPPASYLQELNREFRSDAALRVPRDAHDLPVRDGNSRAGVSSFGMSGVNAHMVLSARPASPSTRGRAEAPGLLMLSAATSEGLRALTLSLREALATRSDLRADDVAHTMARRARHAVRGAVAFSDRQTLREGLDSLIQERSTATVQRGEIARASRGPVFVLSGQGSQWVGMGQELFAREPAFAASLREQDRVLRGLADWSLLELLGSADERTLADTEKAQPLLFAFQVALVALYRAHGVAPAAVIGHSLGEITAAHVAGLLDLESALRLVVARGRLMGEARDQGYMASVSAPVSALEDVLSAHSGQVSVAAVNAPDRCVLAGETRALDALREHLSARGIATERLPVAYAFHSPQMRNAARGMEQVAAPIRMGTAVCAMFSTVRGQQVSGADLQGPEGVRHWADNVRERVRFADAVHASLAAGYRAFLELAPRAVLSTDVASIAESAAQTVCVVPAQRRSLGQQSAFHASLGSLFCAGIDVGRFSEGRLVELPSYPFQLEPYWLPRTKRRRVTDTPEGHPWLGAEIRPLFAPDARIYQRTFSADEGALLSDHRIVDRAVLPAVLYLEAAIHVGLSAYGSLPLRVEDVRFERMVHVDATTTLQMSAQPGDRGLKLRFAAGQGELTASASALVRRLESASVASSKTTRGETIAADAFYATLAQQGMQYGPTYARIARLQRRPDGVFAELRLDPEARAAARGCHLLLPLLDAALHACLALTPTFGTPGREVFVPVSLAGMTVLDLSCAADEYVVDAKLVERDDKSVRFDVQLGDASGRPLVHFDGVVLQRIRVHAQTTLLDQVLCIDWEPRVLRADESTQRPRSFLLVSDDASEFQPLSDLLRSLGHEAAVTTAVRLREEKRLACDELVVLAPDDGPSFASVLDACLTVAHVAQLAETRPVRLWLVTRGAHAVARAEVDPWQAPINGLGRALAAERADLRCVRVDLEANLPGAELDALLLDELLEHDDEDEIAYRSGVRYVARLRRERRLATQQKPLAVDGAHLITGGTGGIGLHVASYLLRRGARHVILCARSEPSAIQKQRIAELDRAGTKLHVLRADLGDEASVVDLLARVREIAPLRSVFHAAGVLDDGAITSLDRPRFERVLAPKLAAHYLDLHTRADALDHFVLFSSISALIGSPGQTNYCAGNAFMDALAQARSRAGLPGLSLGWGAWRDTGMLSSGHERRLAVRGLDDFDPDEGIEALDALLGHDDAQLGVALFDPDAWQAHYPHLAEGSLLRALAPKPRGPRVRSSEVDAGEELRAAHDAASRSQVLHRHVTRTLCAITGIRQDRIEAGQTFASLGMDSLMTMELRNRINALFATDLTLSQFLDQGSVARIAALLDDRLATMALSQGPRPANDLEMEELSL